MMSTITRTFQFQQQTKPLKANLYAYSHIGVKSNPETQIYSNIYFNSVFWNMFISLKNETEHRYYNTFPQIAPRQDCF